MSYKEEYLRWLNSPALSAEEKAELEAIKDDEKEIETRFYGPLEFGTAGLRGTMKTGLHNMNVHVIRHATQAFAEVILAEGEEAVKKGVAIDFDCRNNSAEFARTAAQVMAANGIRVRIFDALRPTPEVSFAVREYGCIGALAKRQRKNASLNCASVTVSGKCALSVVIRLRTEATPLARSFSVFGLRASPAAAKSASNSSVP